MENNDERYIRDCKEGHQLVTQNDEFLRRLDWLKVPIKFHRKIEIFLPNSFDYLERAKFSEQYCKTVLP